MNNKILKEILFLWCESISLIKREGLFSFIGESLKFFKFTWFMLSLKSIITRSTFPSSDPMSVISTSTISPDIISLKKKFDTDFDLRYYLKNGIFNPTHESKETNKILSILYIDDHTPQPDKDAGSVVTFNFICILSSMGYKITFWSNDQKRVEPYTTELQQRGVEVIYEHQSFKKFIQKRNNVYSICITTRPYFSKKYIDNIRHYSQQCKIIYIVADLHFVRIAREAFLEKSKIRMMMSLEIKKLEFWNMNNSDLTIFHSENECKFALTENKSLNAAVIPIPYFLDFAPKSFSERTDLLFLGNYKHSPNLDAIQYFVTDIFPLITKELPDLKLYVVGSNVPDFLADLCSKTKNCILIGFVKDLTPYLGSCKIMVSPLRYGSGIKGKIILSMLSSLPVITTNIGAEGISANTNSELLIVDKLQDFANKTIDLYKNELEWNKLSSNAKKFAEINYSPELVRASFEKVFESILNH